MLSVLILAIAGAVFSLRLFINLFRYMFRRSPRFSVLTMAMAACLILLVVAYNSSLPISWHDTHSYHLNAVKWASTYPAVPGLVNLNARLAYNSSFLLFAALTDVWILRDRSAHVALGFLLSMISIQWLVCLTSAVRHRKDMLPKVFCMLTVPFLLAKVFSIEAASLSTDLAVSL